MITMLPIKPAGSQPAAQKGPASHRARERSAGEAREKFLVYGAEWGLLVTQRIEPEEGWWSGSYVVCGGLREVGGRFGHYMKPKYNSSPSSAHSRRFMSLLCLPQAPYGFFEFRQE